MQDSGTTNDKVLFRLGGEKPKANLPDDSKWLPFLAEAGRWEQYNDGRVYEYDTLVRKWIAKCSESSQWRNNYKKRRYTMSMVFEQVFGEKFDQSIHSNRVKLFTNILAYYSTKIQKSGSIDGKVYTKTIYTISPRRGKGKPFSLRLRLEWLEERGELPTWKGMALPKDDLKPGHARNPKTEANMERRRAKQKARYNERYNKDRDRQVG